jgi:hypothetical protein
MYCEKIRFILELEINKQIDNVFINVDKILKTF